MAVAVFDYEMPTCLHPFRIVNPSLKKFIRERVEQGFSVSWEDEERFLSLTGQERVLHIPCGKCIYCFQRKQDQWRTRLFQERKNSFTSYFVTLTYADENLPPGAHVCKKDVQKFMKRLRHDLAIPTRYFMVSEYGPLGTRRPHYHFAFFFKDFISLDDMDLCVRRAWNRGTVTTSSLEDGRINYLSTYCIKFFNEPPEGHEANFMLCSRRPFIGADYLSSEIKDYLHERKDNVVKMNGIPHVLPRIYREKTFDDVEKVEIRDKVKHFVEEKQAKELEIRQQYNSDADFYEAQRFREQRDFKRAFQKFKESKKI